MNYAKRMCEFLSTVNSYMGTGGIGGDPPWPPQGGMSFDHPPGGSKFFQRKITEKAILHYPFMTPGNHNVPWWKISMQKCIKSQIYTIPFWPSENPLETLEKNFAAKRSKMRFFENRFWPPSTPPGGPTVRIYRLGPVGGGPPLSHEGKTLNVVLNDYSASIFD